MIKKIKGKKIFVICYLLFVIFLLAYTRFFGLNWGLPYPFHPDERNMANAIQGLNCEVQSLKFKVKDCFNPHFFAYGQFPLYLGYLLILIYKGLFGKLGEIITFEEAVLSLRLISALASILNFLIIIKIIKLITGGKKPQLLHYFITSLLIIFSPFFIQFSHFGTTESLLMLFYSLIIYLTILLIEEKISVLSFIFQTSFFIGLALATKISAAVFLIIPIVFIFFLKKKKFLLFYQLFSKFFDLLFFFLLSFLFFFGFSPHNLISFNDFLGAIKYESDVGLGRYIAFYTRQFIETIPIIFQFEKIFPYALGWVVFVLGVLGFLGLSWRDKKINLLRLAFLVYFLPNAFLFTKWTRFMAPIFPIILILAILFLERIRVIRVIKIIIVIISLIPGLAYLSIYQNADVRFIASEWIYKNIPENSYILSETANVVDIPVVNKNYNDYKSYNYISFNFYDLDESLILQEELKNHLRNADYIFVPSRRIFANHTCNLKNQKSNIKYIDEISKIFKDKNCQLLKQKYPLLNKYYEDLFNGRLSFEKIAEFSSYPKVKFQILNFKFKLEFPDEEAEETWTVFDHPVVRIYKKIANSK